jgi:hypothetical protein
MENTIKISDKKIITTKKVGELTIVEQWEPYPGENDPKNEFIIYKDLTYYLTSRKEK